MSTMIRTTARVAPVAAGILLTVLATSPASHAQGAGAIVPADDRDVPHGSQIPDRRIEKTESMVKAYKAEMKRKELAREGAERIEPTEAGPKE